MNDYIYVGKIINTFGIKGELKVLSDFEYRDRIFKSDMPIYIGNEKVKEIISSIRIHKNYPLVLFKGYTNINEVLKYKGENIYINRGDLPLKEGEYLISDLIGYTVYDNNLSLGVVIDFELTSNNTLLKVKGDKNFYIPLVSEYIKEVNPDKKEILTNNGKNLII